MTKNVLAVSGTVVIGPLLFVVLASMEGQDVKRTADFVELVSSMEFDGTAGLEIKSEPGLQLRKGFTIECRIRPLEARGWRNIVTKDGEYILRIDGPPEGNCISFFVNLYGKWEPRVRSIKPEANQWYHIIATWDGIHANLWVNGLPFTQSRPGTPHATNNPVIIGRWAGPAGGNFIGTIEQLRIYNRALSTMEIMDKFFPPEPGMEHVRLDRADFEFDKDVCGWRGMAGMSLECEDGVLSFTISDRAFAVISPRLDVKTEGNDFISLRMAVDKGQEARLAFITDTGAKVIPFPVKSDGAMHNYIFEVVHYPEWQGRLLSLAVFPPYQPGLKTKIDFLKIGPTPVGDPVLEVKILPDRGLCRAMRDERVIVYITNKGAPARDITATIVVPAGIQLKSTKKQTITKINFNERKELNWTVQATKPMEVPIEVMISGGNLVKGIRARFTARFAPAKRVIKADYVPEPKPVRSKYLIGINYFPGWKQGTHLGWQKIEPFPERKPVLGWYDEGSPEVKDWEIKWCLEHGVSFFNYCWYGDLTPDNRRVVPKLAHALHDGLFKSRYGSMFKFTITFENWHSSKISSISVLLDVFFRYWLENYFVRPNYLKIDNKPVLFIIGPDKLRDELGGVENVRKAFQLMREECRKHGFDGLIIIAMYHKWPHDPEDMKKLAEEGYDATSTYVYLTGRFYECFGKPEIEIADHLHTPAEAIKMHEAEWESRKKIGILPDIPVLSMGWDCRPWDHVSPQVLRCRFVIPPEDFKILCQKVLTLMEQTPKDRLDSKIILLNNWNEWGEGHYLAPCREYGFGYLEAVREVFTGAPKEYDIITPDDVGLGPYDSLYRKSKTPPDKRTWEFDTEDDILNWGCRGMEKIELKAGCLVARTTSRDPQMCARGMKLKSKEWKKALIRMSVDKGTVAQLFWATRGTPRFNEPMSIRFNVTADGQFHEYTLNLGEHRLWYGEITELRFDPINATYANVKIDYIRLLKE